MSQLPGNRRSIPSRAQESEHFKAFRPVVGDLLADRKIEIFTMVSDGKTKR